MLPAQRNKVDISSMTEEEQKLFRLYGKLPQKKNHLNKNLTERKYFDSGDYALSKAGKAPHAAVGTAIPSPEDIPHANNPTSPVPAAHGNGGLSVSPNTAVSSPQKNYPGGGMAMSPPKFQGAGFGSSAFSPTNGSSLSGEPTRPEQPGTALPPRSVEQSMSERATSVSKPASARPEPTDMAFPMEE